MALLIKPDLIGINYVFCKQTWCEAIKCRTKLIRINDKCRHNHKNYKINTFIYTSIEYAPHFEK